MGTQSTHTPDSDGWTVVFINDGGSPVLSTGCSCGSEWCGWTLWTDVTGRYTSTPERIAARRALVEA